MNDYNHLNIEKKWQKEWTKKKAYKTQNPSASLKKKKYYVLDMFPYPSGSGLHVGHPKGYIGSDIFARFKRMQGFNVLHPMGYDAFGLPAEQYAIQNNIHPRQAVLHNIKTFEKQLSIIGLSYDWDRRVNTTDPDFYKFTQFIFLKIYNSWYNKKTDKAEPIAGLVKIFEKEGNKKVDAYCSEKSLFSALEWKAKTEKEKQDILMNYRLAYEGESEVNWSPALGTVLANDEIVDSPTGPVSERGGFPVEKKKMRQWFLRITAYAERLISGLDGLDWSDHIKEIQKNWIGKSDGLVFSAQVYGTDMKIETFSAHFEACYADTFFVIAPDHPLLPQLVAGLPQETTILDKAKEMVSKRSLCTSDAKIEKEIDGIFTGRYAVDPLGNGNLPIWVASFALADYGTGIVKCSAHDERDFAFAKKFNIKLKVAMVPLDETLGRQVMAQEICFADMTNGILLEPLQFRGKNAHESRGEIVKYLVSRKLARVHSTYKMRDAVFARQRYWGEPIPLYRDKNGIIHEVTDKNLPLKLPSVESYKPTGTGESPLSTVPAWVKKGYESNTMPGWAGSSWYFLRYMDPKNKKVFADQKIIKYWKDVDMYVGGAEHATGHLLYSRFWHKVLFDYKLVPTDEPFKTLRNQGMILGSDNRKMSKRWGNVINPDEIVRVYGADTLRVYEVFMGPFDASLPWSTENIIGSRRFMEKVWKLSSKIVLKTKQKNPEFEKLLHKTIKKVTEDIARFTFNTSISAMMILVNEMDKQEMVEKAHFELFLKILSPFAPHITEELWHHIGNKALLVNEKWPKFDPKKITDSVVKIIIQINGKVRADCMMPADATQASVLKMAESLPGIEKWLIGRAIDKVIYIPGKLVNIVLV